jgi:exosortase/archaeosortase family protein
MDQKNQTRSTLVRTVIAGIVVFALMHTTKTVDVLSWLTRPAVASVIALFGGEASSGGSDLIVGRLRIPWSRDCAGFDVLLVLWGLILWTSRHDSVSKRFWLRMVLAIPASCLANIARVLTIIGWRQAFYPAVESPQTHYFIGFLWLLPLLVFFVPRGNRRFSFYAVETSTLAAALSLVAPQASAPGGVLVTICALLLLSGQQWRPLSTRLDYAMALAWFAAAIFITGAAMESLWLPWLLICPWCMPRRWLLRPTLLLFFGTIPLFAIKFPWLAIPGIVAALWMLLREHPAHDDPNRPLSWKASVSLLLMLFVPFMASTLGPAFRSESFPPPGVMYQTVDVGSYRLRYMGQSPEVSLTWHAPSGSGRHHTLAVCLLYRGSKIHHEATCPGVQTDGKVWLAEAFLMPDGGLYHYDDYLRETLLPFTSAGVHLIASTRCDNMSADEFRQIAHELFETTAQREKSRN